MDDETPVRSLDDHHTEPGRRPPAERRAALDSALLTEIGLSLVEATTEREIRERLSRHLVPNFADACIFDLLPADADRSAGEADESLIPAPASATNADLRSERTLFAVRRVDQGGHPQAGARVWLGEAERLISDVLRSGKPALRRSVTIPAFDETEQTERDERALRPLDGADGFSLIAVPLIARGDLLGAVTLVRGSERDPFTLDDLHAAESVVATAALAIREARREMSDELRRQAAERAQRHLTLLYRASAALGSSPLEPGAIARFIECLVPALADSVWIHLLSADATAPAAADAAAFPEAQPVGEVAFAVRNEMGDRAVGFINEHRIDGSLTVPEYVVRAEEAVVLPALPGAGTDGSPDLAETAAALRGVGLSGVVSLPLAHANGEVTGSLTLVCAESRPAFDRQEVALGRELASRLALAFDLGTVSEDQESQRAMRAESSLAPHENGSRLRAVLRAVPDRMARVSVDGYIRDYRAGAQPHYPRDADVRGRHLSEVVPPDVSMRLMAAIGEAVATKLLQTVEIELPVAGETLTFEVRLAPIGQDEVLAIGRDTTRQRRAELLLRVMAEVDGVLAVVHDAREALGRATQLLVPAIADWCTVHLVGPNGVVERVVTVGEAVHNLSESGGPMANVLAAHDAHAKEISRTGRADFFPDARSLSERANAADPRIGQLLGHLAIHGYMAVPIRTGEDVVGVLSLGLAKSGRSYTLEDLVMAEGLAQRMALAIEHARLHEEQRAAQARIVALAAERANVLSQIADGVLTVNPDGEIVFINEAAHRLHGGVEISTTIQDYVRTYRPSLLDGRPLSVDELEVTAALRERQTTLNSEWRLRGTDGEERSVLVSAAPILTEGDQLVGAVMTMHDITAQRAFERHREELITSVSQDLRVPLTSIKGWVQILMHRAAEHPGREEDLHALEAIVEQARAMQRLLDKVLDASRYQLASPLGTHRRHLDLVSLTRQLVELHQSRTRQHRVLFSETSAPEAFGYWDADRLRQMLGYLLDNAIKYSPNGGDITVTVDPGNDHVTITVRDEGIGIPPEAIAHVFDQFYRADNVNGRTAGHGSDGLGLGLFSARRIAERMGGRITVESELGRGSTFTVILPRFE